jgi:hypothetical protein
MDTSPNASRVRLSDALFTTIRSAVETDPQRRHSLLLYTSFGVVRGSVSAAAFEETNRMADVRVENTSRVTIEPDVLELQGASVEHYSNHLPTGSYERLFVRIADVQGFAIDEEARG